ncbi:MAG: hypothetical protein WA484_01500 [Solirubrobacteraceae bacterium]
MSGITAIDPALFLPAEKDVACLVNHGLAQSLRYRSVVSQPASPRTIVIAQLVTA